MDTLIQDLRYALRQLRKSPGFAILATATIALGIGPTTAVMSIANRLVLRSVPGVVDPDRVAMVETGQMSPRGGISPISLSYSELRDVMNGVPSLAGMAMVQPGPDLSVVVGSEAPARMPVIFASGDYFKVLGVAAQRGRVFTSEDEPSFGASGVVVISDNLWASQFARSPDAVGKTIRVNTELLTIVGIAPRGFRGTDLAYEADLWLPGMSYPRIMHYAPDSWARIGATFGFYNYVARLKNGVTATEAQEQLRTVIARLPGSTERVKELSKANVGMYVGLGVPGRAREQLHTTLRLLFGIAALVWVVSCANLANLLLARASRRRGETGIRQAIGASPSRLVRSQIAEGLTLALLGVATGLLVAVGLVRLFEGLTYSASNNPESLQVDWRVLGVALAGAALTGMIAAVIPGGFRRDGNLGLVLQQSARSRGTAASRVRQGLTVVQLSVSMVLLVGAFLFVRSLWNLRRIDLGFDPSAVMSFAVRMGDLGYTEEQQKTYRLELLGRLNASPDIKAASFSISGPLVGMTFLERAMLPDGSDTVQVASNPVSARYFDVLGIPLVRGDGLGADDQGGMDDRVVLSEGLAARLFGKRDPLGQTVALPARGTAPPRMVTVVGIARDTRWGGLDKETFTVMYQPLFKRTGRAGGDMLLVRGRGSPAQTIRTVRDVSRALDPGVAISRELAFSTFVDRHVSSQRMFARILTFLSVVAVTLGAVGLYGLMVLGVSQRTREFGIRMALGAEVRDIVRMVVRQGAFLSVAGVVPGLVIAFGLSRFIANRLYGVSAVEMPVYGLAALLLIGVGILATVAPARAAAKVDPMVAVRSE